MGITVLKDGCREYFRITKAWEGKEIQKYVRIGKDRKKAEKEAVALDATLAQRFKAHQMLRQMRGDGVLHEDGRVVGLQLQKRTRKGRKDWQEFKIRIKLPDMPAKHKTVSIGAHGIDKAFDLAVVRICALRDIELNSELHQQMMSAKDFYVSESGAGEARKLVGLLETNEKRCLDEGEELLAESFKASFDDYMERRHLFRG